MSKNLDKLIGINDIELQNASFDIWDKKYRLKDSCGFNIDNTISDMYERVASAISNVETTDALKTKWYDNFLWALKNGAVPAGRINSNAGAGNNKPVSSTINCTVSGTINDDMKNILGNIFDAGMTLKAGCGIGYEFSTLRPKGAYVFGPGATTSGPLSFMDIYDKTCFTISSAGGRRGAQMATFDVSHPDVKDFITVKREDGRLRQFNLSLLITEEFIEHVKHDLMWDLVFPISKRSGSLLDKSDIVWKPWPVTEGYWEQNGLVACKIFSRVKAKDLWDMIMKSTYDYAEPGFILIDKVNDMNNNWWCENIRATNPCGEQPLPPYGACLLGSINLTVFVNGAFGDKPTFDWDKFKKVIKIFTRMLDNVVDINNLPLAKQRIEILNKRRHGMGFFGLGSTVTMLKMKYGSKDACKFTEKTSRILAIIGWESALELAKEKGPAPIMNETFTITDKMIKLRPEMINDGYNVGDVITGKVLHANYSHYMQKIAKECPELVKKLSEVGARFTHHTSIAPTGTIALSLGNNASNGIEPSFAHEYFRNIIREGKKTKEKISVSSFELLAYRTLIDSKASPEIIDGKNSLPDYFISSETIDPKKHVDMQAAAQIWIDSSISKTINIPSNYDFEKFKDVYMYAYEKGLKGCTTFRFNPTAFQGVLITEKDLKETTYQFVLDDGTAVNVKGDEQVDYDGEIHTAANLYDALKEGYYNKL